MSTTLKESEKRTLYFDSKEARYITILLRPGKSVFHFKHPRTLLDPAAVEEASKEVTWP